MTREQADYLKARQDGTTVDLYLCTDGVLRTGYEKSRFDDGIKSGPFGFLIHEGQ